MRNDLILILDMGGNQAYDLARRLRGERFYCEIVPGDVQPEELASRAPKGVICAGGESPSLRAQPLPFAPEALGVPLLAFGGAARMLAERIGAGHRGIQLEGGKDFLQFSPCPLFEGLDQNDRFFERVDGYDLPEGYSFLAGTPAGLAPAFGCAEANIYALQFSVESNDPDGLRILENFAEKICACARNWSVESFAPRMIEALRAQLSGARALLPVSGGVDSTVAAALLHRAIGGRLSCLFINTGLLRKGEPEFVRRVFQEQLGMNLIEVDAEERFLRALSGVCDPAEKRRIVRSEYSAIFAEQYIRAGEIEYMAEATIYPDVLGGLPELVDEMIEGCRRIEPLRQLFKEDVRALGRYLDLPEELIVQPSFERSGLAVRCIGEVTAAKLSLLREADAIFREEVERAGLTRKIAQYFAILTDARAEGQGGGHICVLRALGCSGAGRAPAYKLPYDLMEAVVRRISEQLCDIGHVVYDITGCPAASAEWE